MCRDVIKRRTWQVVMSRDHARGNVASFPYLGRALDHVELSHHK